MGSSTEGSQKLSSAAEGEDVIVFRFVGTGELLILLWVVSHPC